MVAAQAEAQKLAESQRVQRLPGPRLDAQDRIFQRQPAAISRDIGVDAVGVSLQNIAGIGIDRSENALRVARENLDALGLAERTQLICGDWSAGLDQRFDLVVANPPYIASKDIPSLAREVRIVEEVPLTDGYRPIKRRAFEQPTGSLYRWNTRAQRYEAVSESLRTAG